MNKDKNLDNVENQQLNIGGAMHRLFTIDDLIYWGYNKEYLIDILNGEYKLEDAQEDLAGLIGSEFDSRTDCI